MRVIILAAGAGTRMGTSNLMPKCLLKINGTTIIERLINQLQSLHINDITLVVGYKKKRIIDVVSKKYKNVKFICNHAYMEDTNILSLTLALKDRLSPYYLFEADCVFDNDCIDLIFDPRLCNRSVWFSKGSLKSGQYGGIIKADNFGKVKDLRIINQYDQKYKCYNKLIGIMKVGKTEIDNYASYLFKAYKKNIKQYYHSPWIKNLTELNSYLCDFGDFKVASVNSLSDYESAKEIFKNEPS